MKLFYILPEYDPQTSTHFRYNVELLEEVAQKMQVTLFIEKGVKPKVKNIQNVIVGRAKFLPLRILERKLIFLKARLSGHKVFYSHYGYLSALIAGILCRFTGGKLYFWHCEYRGNYEKKDCLLCNLPEKLTKNWPFRWVLKLSHHLVTCTDKMKQYYNQTFGVPLSKIKVMSNWVDTENLSQFSKEKKAAKPTILFVHWLSPRKGTRILPELLEAVVKKNPEVKLVVAGEGPDLDWLNKEWKARGLEKNVEMLGAVPNEKVFSLYGKAHVFLHPSREEEFGRVLIEAMAIGTPIVATHTDGAQSILNPRQKQWLFDYKNPKKGADLVLRLLASKKEQEELKKTGLEHVKKFSKAEATRSFLGLF
ncbi:MAG: glycosyltransferase family 4 protein [Patescibacteria group bacterium]